MRAIAWLLILVSCHRPAPPPPPVAPTPEAVVYSEETDGPGLRMTVRDARPEAVAGERVRTVEGEPLTEARARSLLARAEPLEAEDEDARPFRMRKGSKPPPRTGADVKLPFPSDAERERPAETPTGPLEVVRYAPEGEVPIAPHVAITFSQPMVAVTSQEEAAREVPARLDPQPPGAWRWLGTKTLLFDPDPRLPMATAYEVTVPAGTISATGGALESPHSFAFRTPPPSVERHAPAKTAVPLEPVIALVFDQAVEPAAIAEHATLRAGRQSVALRLATEAEVEADPHARALSEQAEEGRFVALRPVSPLERATDHALVLPPGTPSAEGPLTTNKEQRFAFRTFDRLRLERAECGWGECRPGAPWTLEWSNPIADGFDTAAITIDPPLPDAQIDVSDRWMTVRGPTLPRTTYTVTVPASLPDVFGQTLGKDEQVTFAVGPASPTLIGPDRFLVTLDPTGPRTLAVHAINHDALKVEASRVRPEDWAAVSEWLRRHRWDQAQKALPGSALGETRVKVEAEADTLSETAIDLSPWLDDELGHLLLRIQPVKQPQRGRQEVVVWVQSTRLGLTAFTDARQVVGWVTRLADGSPIEGATVALTGGKGSARTGADGLAALERGEGEVLVASVGADVAMLPRHEGWWGRSTGWFGPDDLDQLRWYVVDDRGLYKPGETAHVKGWLRRQEVGPGGDIAGTSTEKIRWTLRGPRGNDLGTGEVPVSRLGGFHLEVAFPDDVNLGTARLELEAVGASGVASTGTIHPLQIQEFRRPEYEVSATAEEGPHLLGTSATIAVEASYYAGGGLPDAEVRWDLTATPATYRPPGHGDHHFGPWNAWWMPWRGQDGESSSVQHQSRTDMTGEHRLAVHFDAMDPVRPYQVRAEATVFDVNRQGWTAGSDLLVHPGALYVGLRSDAMFVEAGQPLEVGVRVVDIDGEQVEGRPIVVDVSRVRSRWIRGDLEEEVEAVHTCELVSGADDVACRVTPERGGTYRFVATVRDDEGRRNVTEVQRWVTGGELAPSRGVEQEEVVLVPEQRELAPGDVARVLVQAPFAPAEGTLTVQRAGLVRTERFRMEGATHTLEVPVDEGHVPNLVLQVDLVGQARREGDHGEAKEGLPPRVAYAQGRVELEVPPLSRTLDVEVRPAETALQPGTETRIDLVVRDADGAPVPDAELAVVVADEAVLALTGYRMPDPIEVFYAARPTGVDTVHQRAQVLLAAPDVLAALEEAGVPETEGAVMDDAVSATQGFSGAVPMAPPAPRMARAKAAEADEPAPAGPAIAVRTDFRALALFAPEVRTDAEGRATVPLTLPDSLTRYRIMVVAASGERRFGYGEADLTARLPLMVRPSLPRFLSFGDQAELPVVLQNQTDAAMEVEIALGATNLALTDRVEATLPSGGAGVRGRRVTVPANDRVEVRFPAATRDAGTARVQVVAASGRATDAARVELPVWTPATTEAFATYGTVTGEVVVQPVAAPADAWPQVGGLEVTASSTRLQALTDAFLYLHGYPFECNEQIASRILAVAALRDVLAAFEAEGLPPAEEIEASMMADIDRLAARQASNGGWAMWRRGDPDWPYVSVHVAHALARAEAAGYAVPENTRRSALAYLKRIERHIPRWYSEESKRAIRAYALLVRHRMGETDGNEARKLLAQASLDAWPMEGLGWLLPVLQADRASEEVARIERHLQNRVAETAAGAHFVTSYADGEHVLLHSSRRVDGVLLDALLEVDPELDLVPKLVEGLLAHRTRGRWGNTQENAFVLLALRRYFEVYEGTTPDFVARIWLGDDLVGEHAFRGRTTERAHVEVPMAFLQEQGADDLVLAQEGEGRLYYRIGLRYAPRDLRLDPADHGFEVERVYEPVDDPEDVTRDPDGTWRIRSGATVRVRISMVAPMRRYHVALVDPLPAGLEPQNPALATTGALPPDPAAQDRGSWWRRTWYEHQNLRDERAEAFTSLLWPGVHEYTWVARATTPGRYVVAPARAEEMYTPETFGRSGTDLVVVE